jgi:phosphatidate phosphatase APP1
MSWIEELQRLGYSAEEAVDRVRRRIRERTGTYGALDVVPYPGDGGPGGIRLSGRVLEEGGAGPATEDQGPLDNLLAMARRFESDEVPDVEVLVRVGEREVPTVTDDEGYFHVDLPPGGLPEGVRDGWLPVHAEVAPDPGRGIHRSVGRGRVRVPGAEATFGVVSDVDDTVMRTGATSLVAVARSTLLGNARTREPFLGVATFYRALERGPDGRSHNPFFYVSSSPWNLYDLIEEFLGYRGIPRGAFFLRDMGLGPGGMVATGGHRDHKLSAIEGILRRHPNLEFVLVGDSGQRDPEVYREVVRAHPGRIRVVYIRDLTRASRDREVQDIAAELRAADVEMKLVPDTRAAAAHAAATGLIPRS